MISSNLLRGGEGPYTNVTDIRTSAGRAMPRVIAVGGGKGGIGKSLLSSNLSIALAQRGLRVVAVDVDLGAANLHTSLGIEAPAFGLSDFLGQKVVRLDDAVAPTGIPNLGIVSGARDSFDMANPKVVQKISLIRNIRRLDAEFVVLDLGAGTGNNTLDFFLIADHGLLLLAPEPSSIENGHRFVKAAFFRKMSAVLSVFGIAQRVEELLSCSASRQVTTPLELVEAVKRIDARAGATLEAEMRRFRGSIVLNQARSEADRKVGPAVELAWRRHFGLELSFLGAIDYDSEVVQAARRRRAVMLDRPECAVARAIGAIADQLLEIDTRMERTR